MKGTEADHRLPIGETNVRVIIMRILMRRIKLYLQA